MDNYEGMNPAETVMDTEAKQIEFCTKCGAELEQGQVFCSRCGQRTTADENSNSKQADPQINSTPSKTDGKKKTIIISAAIAFIALAVVAGVLLIPRLGGGASVEKLCEQGKYEEAYKKAGDDKKKNVLAENMIAYLFAQSMDYYKEPAATKLDAGWCTCAYEEGKVKMSAVLKVTTDGVSGYFVCLYSADDKSWEFLDAVDELSENGGVWSKLGKIIVEGESTVKLDKTSISNINSLHESDQLEQVKMIEYSEIEKSYT